MACVERPVAVGGGRGLLGVRGGLGSWFRWYRGINQTTLDPATTQGGRPPRSHPRFAHGVASSGRNGPGGAWWRSWSGGGGWVTEWSRELTQMVDCMYVVPNLFVPVQMPMRPPTTRPHTIRAPWRERTVWLKRRGEAGGGPGGWEGGRGGEVG